MRQKPILNKVTLTGADNSTDPKELLELSVEFPFVEWGILVSEASTGKKRFPSYGWITNFVGMIENAAYRPKVSAHVCGRWSRNICAGNWTLLDAPVRYLWPVVERVQLNARNSAYKMIGEDFQHGRSKAIVNRQYIIQVHGKSPDLALAVIKQYNTSGALLFDASGGRGSYTPEMPRAVPGVYCGYAGGLRPEFLDKQLEDISKVCGDEPIWIDAESGVRSPDNSQFDMQKVRQFLEAASEWMVT